MPPGVSLLAGSFASARVKFWASAMTRARVRACSRAASTPAAATTKASTDFLSSAVLYRSGSKSPRMAPSTAAAYAPLACPPSSAKAILFRALAFR